MDNTRLVFGLGATKAGSGMLSRYLRAHPECQISVIKELHFFDSIENGTVESRVQELKQRKRALASERHLGNRGLRQRVHELRRWWPVMQSQDPAAYVDFLSENAGDAKLMADITPAYALLPKTRLNQMAQLLPDVRFVYLMRDPVARLWSHVRMVAKWQTKDDSTALARRADALLSQAVSDDRSEMIGRGAYKQVITRLKAAVEKSQLFLGFFEDLIAGALIAPLTGFLDIAPVPARLGRKVHQGIDLSMTETQRSQALAFLRPQYEYVGSEMGRLPAAWDASLARG